MALIKGSLNPNTLKPGNVVVFGGAIEKTVVDVQADENAYSLGYVFFGEYRNESDVTISSNLTVRDELWKIAQLKKPKLPNQLGDEKIIFTLNYSSGHYDSTAWVRFPASSLLRTLKASVEQLEAAGVTE